jgi:CBS domain-containing protein/anti-sigma regulatory factor (Ser/Thr protein kinase)
MEGIPTDGDEPSVVHELLYRLKVRDIMTTRLVTAGEDEGLRDAQAKLRDKRITGLPVERAGKLIGIISMGDIIQAMDEGRMDGTVGDVMSRNYVVLQEGMPLAFAISCFDKYGYGRFPVLDGDSMLVGIVTPSDVMRALLVELNNEVLKLERDLKRDPSPAFAGGVSFERAVARFDFENAGKASAELKRRLKALGADPAVVRRAAVASYELELNQAIHSDGGAMRYRIDQGEVLIRAEDRGPGIPDLELAMREGWSTANDWIRSLGFGAGMGLANAKRVSDEFNINSGPGQGTVVEARIRLFAGGRE